MCNCINKVVLVIVNIFFFLAGAAIVGVSIWVIVSKNTLFNLVQVATQGANIDNSALANYQNSTSTLLAAAYVVLAFGVLSFVIGFCGCCGAIRESSCLLMIYAGAITIVLLVEIAGGIAAGVFKGQITEQLKPSLTELVRKRYLPSNLANNNSSDPNSIFSSYVNYAQVMLECCGINGPEDITKSGTTWFNSSRLDTTNNRTFVVPTTCCRMNNKDDLMAKQNWNSVSQYLTDPNCPYNATSKEFIMTGCFDSLNSYINKYAIAIIIVAILVGMFEIICVVMACSMIQKIRSEGSQQKV